MNGRVDISVERYQKDGFLCFPNLETVIFVTEGFGEVKDRIMVMECFTYGDDGLKSFGFSGGHLYFSRGLPGEDMGKLLYASGIDRLGDYLEGAISKDHSLIIIPANGGRLRECLGK